MKRISSHRDLVFDAHCAAGLLARTTSGPAPAGMSGIRSTPEGYVPPAPSSGKRRNVFPAMPGRHIRIGMRAEETSISLLAFSPPEQAENAAQRTDRHHCASRIVGKLHFGLQRLPTPMCARPVDPPAPARHRYPQQLFRRRATRMMVKRSGPLIKTARMP